MKFFIQIHCWKHKRKRSKLIDSQKRKFHMNDVKNNIEVEKWRRNIIIIINLRLKKMKDFHNFP